MWQTAVNVILGILSVAGTFGTFYFGWQARKLNRERISFTWDELHAGGRDLAKQVKDSDFSPDIVLTPSIRGATVAGIVVLDLEIQTPLYTRIQEDRTRPTFGYVPSAHTRVETTKWHIFIPESLRAHSDKKILIVDDFAMSGDALFQVKQCLEMFGFRTGAIKSATLVCTTTAIGGGKAPDFYWHKTPDYEFYFPWGRAR